MSVTAEYRFEMLLGIDSPYAGVFDADIFDPDIFDVGSGWTDVTEDVRTNPAPTWERGMRGGSPSDRVADVGVLTFSMNNYPFNTPTTSLGYHTLDHPNQRTGFWLGIGVRLRAVYEGQSTTLFVGTLDSVSPQPGPHASRHVDVTVVDWMEEAATSQVEGVVTMTDSRSDEVFAAIVAQMPRQPLNLDIDPGLDRYPYALDTARQEGVSVQSEFFRLAMSGLEYVYLKAGGTLRLEARTKRALQSQVNAFTFDATFQDVEVKRSRADLMNKVKVTVHPRRVDAAPVVLYRLVQSFPVAPGETRTLFGGFSDPDQRGRRVGGIDLQLPLVPYTDYMANTAEDGSGADLTWTVDVIGTPDSSGVSFQITNRWPQIAHITLLQVRGLGLYDFEHAVMEATDEDSVSRFGRRTALIDMPYQSDAGVGASVARYLLNLYAADLSAAESISFLANHSDTVMRQALALDISDRIGIRETVTGLTDEYETPSDAKRGWFINGVRGEITFGQYLRMTYLLAPAERGGSYWQLGVVGASELGQTTRVGFGIFVEA